MLITGLELAKQLWTLLQEMQFFVGLYLALSVCEFVFKDI